MKAFNGSLSSIVTSVLLCGIVSMAGKAALAQNSGDEANVETVVEVEDLADSESGSEESPPIEAIIVTARQSFFLLNSQIKYATERLYSVYSDLNEIEEFDVECRASDWTGTHIRQQECWPAFFDEIVADNAQDAILGFGDVIPVQQLKRLHEDKFDALRANIVRVASANPAAADALLELGKLEKALEIKKEECKEQPALLFVLRICR